MTRMQERFSVLLAWSLVGFLSAAVAHAQVTTADLVGTARDSSRAIVQGAVVTLTNEATGVARNATTNADGNYIFTSLPPGTYTLTVEATGFNKIERRGVTLQVNQRAQVDLDLVVGGMGETVVIEGSAPLLESQSSVLGSVIEEQQVQDLPLNGRNFVQLATLSAGVSGAGTGMRGTIMSGTRPDDLRPGTELFVNGNRESSNNYLYDGIDNNTRLTLVIVMRPNVEAIQEFKVQTNLFSAEQGRNPGGQVNVVTRSGGNQIHGSVYEFLRNDTFDANNFFSNRAGQPKPPFKQNQFGFAIGGPIIKNRTFFFADYDGFRQELGRVFVSTVPTLKMRQGDFSELQAPIYDPLTTTALPGGGVSRQPFPGNIIPADALGPGHGQADERLPGPDLRWPLQQPGHGTHAHPGLEPVRRAARPQQQRGEPLPLALLLVEDEDHQPVHLPCRAAAGRLESRGPGQRGHFRRHVGSRGAARRPRMGARLLAEPGPRLARRVEQLRPRLLAGRRRGRGRARRAARDPQREPAGLSRTASRSSAPAGYTGIGQSRSLPILRKEKTYQFVANLTYAARRAHDQGRLRPAAPAHGRVPDQPRQRPLQLLPEHHQQPREQLGRAARWPRSCSARRA